MRIQNMDREWKFARGSADQMASLTGRAGEATVNLPHDYMIENPVYPEAPSSSSSGYFNAGVAYYRKTLSIPAQWEGDRIALRFDGVMMNATLEVNGGKVTLHHYGYSPFLADITPYVYCGEENTITITVNPSMQPNSRWYSGAGIFRSVELIHTPPVHIENDGIYGYTKKIDYDREGNPVRAYLQTEVRIANTTGLDHITGVEVSLVKEDTKEVVLSRRTKVQVNAGESGRAHLTLTVENPLLWSAENPSLYQLTARVTDLGIFKTHFVEGENQTTDEDSVLFGIRTVEADPVHGLLVNGKSVKLKGGCVHHDNGLLGAVSLYDAEVRRVTRMKEVGFNALRTTHNPPSKVLLEACDRLGLYVFAEAFDAWGIAKQPGDYNQYFEDDWEEDLTAFIYRDRNHPSVIIWSTGNEIPERGGLGKGYSLAEKLALKVKSLDGSRPVSNAICSFWNGMDDVLMKDALKKMQERKEETENLQNADTGKEDTSWEEMSEPFANGLDIVGYNYMEDKYPLDHQMYPERIILGSENFPKEIGYRWPMVEKNPWVIGDFTWTAYDYIGEAGIGKSLFVDPKEVEKVDPRYFASQGSPFPYRLANDADIDINGNILPQGNYRSVVYGSDATYVFSYDPADFGKVEILSRWGFPACWKCWNWPGKEGEKVSLLVFSRASEVELFINGKSLGKISQGEHPGVEDMPFTFQFEGVYEPGEVLAISYEDGKEISRDTMITTGEPVSLQIRTDKTHAAADGHSLIYAEVEIVDEEGRVVPTAEYDLTASVEGAAVLAGFGTGKPITDQSYVSGSFTSYRGRACGIIRSGYEKGEAVFTVRCEGFKEASVRLTIE